MSFLSQLELATRELVQDELPHNADLGRIVAGLVKEAETPGALQARAAKLVEAGVVDAEEFAAKFVKSHVAISPENEAAAEQKSEPVEEPKPAATLGW